jgi:hypothetical protein
MKRQTYLFYTVQYGSVGRKWSFTWPGRNTLLVDCRGKLQADAVARIIAGSLKRNDNELDNLARANIRDLLNRRPEQD